MTGGEWQVEQAFERIEATILPCLASLLESLLAATPSDPPSNARGMAAEIHSLASEVEQLTRAVESSAGSLPLRPAA